MGFIISSYLLWQELYSTKFRFSEYIFVRESECLLLQVKEIELEGYTEPETAQKKDTKQTAAVDLSKRLKDFRSLNDASSLKEKNLFRKFFY
ncbi:hypothetical protein TSUD_18310 [Trifolium subterraneum]|uniref:Uncharacterized protein n=1 Tax=Trifolium subterraneum TaxID=3900 RepID=A0A2Z6N7K9_TRISU|nr:hypothetical protein TSUD_18310 [Trifolium subterraneum]